jgi:hypothetical protein
MPPPHPPSQFSHSGDFPNGDVVPPLVCLSDSAALPGWFLGCSPSPSPACICLSVCLSPSTQRGCACLALRRQVVMNWLPTYFGSVLHADLAKLGAVKTLPYLFMFGMSNVGGWAGDWLIAKRHRSVVAARKIVNSVGALVHRSPL